MKTKKPLNHQRRIKALLNKEIDQGSNPVAKAMIVQKRGGYHPDARKVASKKACRGRVDADA